MSKRTKLTEDICRAIELYFQEEDSPSVRGAAREVLGSESRESSIRGAIKRGDIVVDGEANTQDENNNLDDNTLDYLCNSSDWNVSNLAKRLRSAQRTNNQLRKVQRELFDGEGESKSLEDILDSVKDSVNISDIYVTPNFNMKATPSTLEVLLSDLQIGKVTRHYNTEKALEGLKIYGEGIVKEVLLRQNTYKLEKIVLAVIGDLIEDSIKHSISSSISTDSGNAQQIHNCIKGLWEYILKPLIALNVKIEYIGVCGNHGSSTFKGMGTFKEGIYSYDYIIHKTLQMLCETVEADIEFNLPEGTFANTVIYGKHTFYEHGYHNNFSEKGMIDQMRKRGAQLQVHPTYWRQGDKHHHTCFGQGEQVLNGAFFGVDYEAIEYSGIMGFNSIPSQTIMFHTDEKSIGKGTVKEIINIQVFVE